MKDEREGKRMAANSTNSSGRFLNNYVCCPRKSGNRFLSEESNRITILHYFYYLVVNFTKHFFVSKKPRFIASWCTLFHLIARNFRISIRLLFGFTQQIN